MIGKGCFYTDLVPAAVGAAGMLAVANPENADLIITRVMIVTTEAGAGATTVDAGIAADAVTADDTLIDGQDVNAVGLVDGVVDRAGNAVVARLWGANEFLTVSKVAGGALSEVGIVAKIYVEYVRV